MGVEHVLVAGIFARGSIVVATDCWASDDFF
jgi:hypothetical protein